MERKKRLLTDLIDIAHTISMTSNEDMHLHCHSEFEIYFFISGNCTYTVEGITYQLAPYSVLLLSPNVFHGIQIHDCTPYERYTLHFLPDAIHSALAYRLLSIFDKTDSIYYDNLSAKNFITYFEDILSCNNLDLDIKDFCLDLRIQSLLSHFLSLSREREFIPKDHKNQQFADILEYINQHITDDIHLQDLSHNFYISEQYLNRLFKKYTGTTIMNYLNHKRIALAKQLILDGTPSTTVSSLIGFQDYSSFFRSFKKICGYAPKELKALQKKVASSD